MSYTAVQAPMIAGLMRARAQLRHYMLSPLVAAPLTAVAAVGVAVASSLARDLGTSIGRSSAWQPASASARWVTPAARALLRESGAPKNLISAEPLVERPAARARVRSANTTRDQGITLAGMPVPGAGRDQAFQIDRHHRHGQDTAIQEILASALARGDRAVIADPDGGYMRRFYRAERGDIVLNPFDARSVKWDLFSEIRNGTTWSSWLDPSFQIMKDRTVVGGATRELFSRRSPARLTRPESRMWMSSTGCSWSRTRASCAVSSAARRRSHSWTSKTSACSIRFARSTSSAVGALEYVGEQNAPEFSVREWVRMKTPGVLFIPYKAGQIAALRSTISAWMRLAIFEAMDQEEQRETESRDSNGRLWFVVDELDALGQIDGLKDALARLRKFGGRCVLGFQSIAQVSSTYGQGDAHTIVENCGNTLILTMLGQRGRRHRPIRFSTDRRSRSAAHHGIQKPPADGSVGFGNPQRASQRGTGGAALAGRTTARPRRVSEIRVGSRVAARAPRCQAGMAAASSGATPPSANRIRRTPAVDERGGTDHE